MKGLQDTDLAKYLSRIKDAQRRLGEGLSTEEVKNIESQKNNLGNSEYCSTLTCDEKRERT